MQKGKKTNKENKSILALAKSSGQRWGTSERKARAGLRVRLLRVSSVGLTERSSGLSPLVWSGRMNSDIKDLLVGASLPVKKKQNLIIRSSHHKGTRTKGATGEFMKRGRRCKGGKRGTGAQVRGVAGTAAREVQRHKCLVSLRAVRLYASLFH